MQVYSLIIGVNGVMHTDGRVNLKPFAVKKEMYGYLLLKSHQKLSMICIRKLHLLRSWCHTTMLWLSLL